MKRINFIWFLLITVLIQFSCSDEDTFKTDLVNFEDFELEEQSYWIGSDGSGQFTSGNKIFYNTYYPDWNTWSGFIYSNVINYIYYNESENYLVARQFEKIVIEYKEFEEPRLVQLTNCTFTALAIKYGYGYAKKFGGRDGTDPDWFKLTITGFDQANGITGTIDYFLADFRSDDSAKDYIIDKWEYVDLTSLGIVKRIEFELSSSDAGTPLYFCLDNLKGRVHY